ncbi:28S ribosomal protein S5, mitochondrial [Sporothrix epigloea]|uniref:28S ribosomal protein S5, mitochondrial n=1 Tax=Sporothrix epigloea TaxID=1892477 RepID=A0ABP0E2Y9_9PEZI
MVVRRPPEILAVSREYWRQHLCTSSRGADDDSQYGKLKLHARSSRHQPTSSYDTREAMSFARANAGVLRRLAGGPEAARCTATLQTTAQLFHAQLTAELSRPKSLLSSSHLVSSSCTSTSRSAPCFAQASRFHTSAPRPARRRRFNSVPAAKLGLVDDVSISRFAEKNFPGYSSTEKDLLGEKYTRAQLAAIDAGEAAIDPKDLSIQGRIRGRTKEYGIDYYDDFSKLQPVIDRRPRDPALAANVAHAFKPMDDKTFAADFLEWMKSIEAKNKAAIREGKESEESKSSESDKDAENAEAEMDIYKYLTERPAFTHADGKTRLLPEETGNSSIAPGLPTIRPGDEADLIQAATRINPDDEGLDESGEYERLMYRTGLKVSEIMGIATREVAVRMVSNQTRLGKIRSYSVIAIAGNGDGRLGMGQFKSSEYSIASARAREMAILNMKPVPRYEDRTIYGNVECKISGTVVQLFSRPPGFGLRVPHRIFEMARAAGIHDLAAKIPRSRNSMNTVKATYKAFMGQRDPEQIAMGRGKKLVDVRKVYYGGAVY